MYLRRNTRSAGRGKAGITNHWPALRRAQKG